MSIPAPVGRAMGVASCKSSDCWRNEDYFMKNLSFKSAFIAVSISVALGYAGLASAYYSAGVPPDQPLVLDPGGNNANATDLAVVTCGSGTDHFSAAVQDLSPPVSGLLVSLHILSENASAGVNYMATATDGVSGNGGWSDIASVYAGPGTYYLSVVKTNVGSRNFAVGWDCRDVNNNSMGTTINVLQMQ